MNISELVFIGIKGSVVALNRNTGEQVWVTHLKGSDFVNVILQKGALRYEHSGHSPPTRRPASTSLARRSNSAPVRR